MSNSRFQIITVQYGDIFWLQNSLKSWNSVGDFVVDVAFPFADEAHSPSELHVARFNAMFENLDVRGHVVNKNPRNHASLQHADAVEELRTKAQFNGSHVILSDPDLWIVRPEKLRATLESLGDGEHLFLEDHLDTNYSHPCLAIFPTDSFISIDLFDGTEDLSHDFGRLWPRQVSLREAPGNLFQVHECVQVQSWGAYAYPKVGAVHFSSQSFRDSHWVPRSLLPWRRWRADEGIRFARRLLLQNNHAEPRAMRVSEK